MLHRFITVLPATYFSYKLILKTTYMKCLTTLILPLALLLSSASCKKDPTNIESGFTCKIDGKRWRTSTSDFKVRENDCRISTNGESILIKAINSGEDFAILVHTVGKVVTEGKYPLNSNAYFVGLYSNPFGSFITGNGNEGEIEIIKIDKDNSRISGKFHFTGYDDKSKQSRSITDGTFNILYRIH